MFFSICIRNSVRRPNMPWKNTKILRKKIIPDKNDTMHFSGEFDSIFMSHES